MPLRTVPAKVNTLNEVANEVSSVSMSDTNLLLVMGLDRYPVVDRSPKAPELY